MRLYILAANAFMCTGRRPVVTHQAKLICKQFRKYHQPSHRHGGMKLCFDEVLPDLNTCAVTHKLILSKCVIDLLPRVGALRSY